MQTPNSPLILSFGVLDPVGAVGTNADQAVFAAHGCHGLAVTTGILIADTARVEDMQEMDADWMVDQARVLLEDMQVAAFKVGAIASVEQVAAIAEVVSDYADVPLILDPFVSCLPDSGMKDEDMLMAVRQILVPQTTMFILSQLELTRLAETWREPSEDEVMELDVAELTGMGCQFVLVTGVAEGGVLHNMLFDADGPVQKDLLTNHGGPFSGAGSTLSAALAALMAQQMDTLEALRIAQEYTAGSLAYAQRFGMGRLIPNRFFHLQIEPNDD